MKPWREEENEGAQDLASRAERREWAALDRLDRLTVMLEALLKVQTVAVSIAASQAGLDAEAVGGMIAEVEAQFSLAQAKPQGAS